MWTLFDSFQFFSGTYVLRAPIWTGGNCLVELPSRDATYYGLWCIVYPTDDQTGVGGITVGRTAIPAPIAAWTYRSRNVISANTTLGNRRMTYFFPLRARLFGETINVWRLP